MKIKTIYTLLLLLLIGFGTRVSAQTNAVLNYPVPAKKRVSTQKQNQQNTGKDTKTALTILPTTISIRLILHCTGRKLRKRK